MNALSPEADPQLNEDESAPSLPAPFGLSGVQNIEVGSVALTAGQLTVTVAFVYEKISDAYIFSPTPYIVDPNDPPQDIRAIVVSQSKTGFVLKLSAAPSTNLSVLHWGVAMPDAAYVNQQITPPVYVLDSNFMHLTGNETALGRKDFPDGGDGSAFSVTALGTGAVARTLAARAGDIVNVKDYGATGDDVTNDTVAVEAARIIANANNSDLYFPAGTYLLTPGGLGWFSCNIYGPAATLKAATNADVPFIKIDYTEKFAFLNLRGIDGFDRAVGTGLYLAHADYSRFRLHSLGNFAVGTHFDGSGNNSHIAVNGMSIEHLGSCGIGLLMSSGGGGGLNCESNKIYINYLNDCSTAAIKIVNGIYNASVSDNKIEIMSLELHPTGDGIVCESACGPNRFTIEGILGVGAGSTGKYIITHGHQNRWNLPNFDLSRIVNDATDVWNTMSNAVDGDTARSQISGDAPPASGKWRVGDVCWNTIGQHPMGWRCTVGGTPGTWTAMGVGAWTNYTPTISASSGAYTTITILSAQYLQFGENYMVRLEINIGDVGTGTGYMQVTLPPGLVTADRSSASGWNFHGAHTISTFIDAGATVMRIYSYNGSAPGVNGDTMMIGGFFKV